MVKLKRNQKKKEGKDVVGRGDYCLISSARKLRPAEMKVAVRGQRGGVQMGTMARKDRREQCSTLFAILAKVNK